MTAYYNEFDPFAAAWLRELIKAGHIAPGDVDERSILEVAPDDIRGYTQCHFFAGIGGWSLALRLAGWPDDRPVWSGSCPCQPFSSAGKQKGKADERHLWPVWFRLIRESRPPVVYGEQVPAAIRHHWWDDVADDLEGEGYTTRAEIRPACSVGAPHRRDRLWFVANQSGEGLSDGRSAPLARPGAEQEPERRGGGSDVADANASQRKADGLPSRIHEKHNTTWEHGNNNFWDGEWIACPDGKARLIEPSIPLLAHGLPNRVGKLRGYGNAIPPKVGAEFIKATQGGNA